MTARRVAVTGAGGRLGRALVAALGRTPGVAPVPWTRPDLDLDVPASLAALVERDRPDAVIHAAAWTDVDGCARQPEVAMRRNGEATGALAAACADGGLHLVVVSTNEVFDGLRTDGRAYKPDDEPRPGNPYGASKLAGERAALASGGRVAVVRTAWLFGPPGRDFPDKILDAAARAIAEGGQLKLVVDEIGNPTFTEDLAAAILRLLESGATGIHHATNAGAVSRAGWARATLAAAGVAVRTEDVPASTWARASTPPLRAVLEPTAVPGGSSLRSWQAATLAYVPELLRIREARLAGAAT